jgi:predicted helicase
MTQFKNFGFYDYQVKAANATKDNNKGIVVMPTGTGKTFVQAGVIANDILNNPGFRMYVVNAPRIMLSYQLLEEVMEFNLNNGVDARYMAVHSGKLDEMLELQKLRKEKGYKYSQINSTTSPNEVSEMITKAKESNQPLIFFSTYNSAIRIEQGRQQEPINMIMNDEAHYLVQERFNTDFNEIVTERKYFFTATTKETPSDKGLGMNNTEFYGERIFIMTPFEAIQLGKIVRPRVHIISTNGQELMTKEDLDTSLDKLVINSFNEHSKLLKNGQKGKMLISASGTDDMKRLIKSDEIKNFVDNGGKFYAVASDSDVSNFINGKKVARKEWLKQLQIDGANKNQKLIVIHYDILTEGIDVPGLTGVLFLRNQSKSKFIQTYGRVARLDKQDRNRISSGKITPNDLNQMNKPYAWIIIPALKREDDDKLANLEDLIDQLRDFGFDPSEDIEPRERAEGGSGEDDEGIVPEDNIIGGAIGRIIEEYNHNIEHERIANMTWDEKIQEQRNQGRNGSLDFDF